MKLLLDCMMILPVMHASKYIGCCIRLHCIFIFLAAVGIMELRFGYLNLFWRKKKLSEVTIRLHDDLGCGSHIFNHAKYQHFV